MLYPGPQAADQIVDLAVTLDIRGHRIFDLHIAQICRGSGVRELWTHDKHFVAVPGFRVRDPLLAARP